jgi:hypothetical protein
MKRFEQDSLLDISFISQKQNGSQIQNNRKTSD